MYFLRGAHDLNKLQWCKENNISYIQAFWLICLIFGIFTEKKLDQISDTIIIFKEEDAMAYKIRWL